MSGLLHEEHERKLHRWLYGDDLKEVTPLPDFYRQVQDDYTQIAREGKATAYVCRNFACNLPTTEVAKMMEQLQAKGN